MLVEYKNRINLGVGVGIVLQIAGQALAKYKMEDLGLIIALLGVAALVWGCVQYAKAKGRSPWFGALGILSILGLIVLFFLPDRFKDASKSA